MVAVEEVVLRQNRSTNNMLRDGATARVVLGEAVAERVGVLAGTEVATELSVSR